MVMAMSERAVRSVVFVRPMLVCLGSTLPELGKVNVSSDKAATHHGSLSTPHHVVVAL
jgi:hypothetical protein